MKQIDDRGIRAAARYPDMLYQEFNWRKGDGLSQMIGISKRERFDQQEYCGCICSLRDTNRHRVASGREHIETGVQYYASDAG